MSTDRAAAIVAELEASISRFAAVASALEDVLDGSTISTTQSTGWTTPQATDCRVFLPYVFRRGRPTARAAAYRTITNCREKAEW